MAKRPSFVPGRPVASGPPLARYRPEQSSGAAGDYVRGLTEPGGLVVDLFCQGPRFVAEALAAGRRVLGFSVNPVLLHAARVGLTPPDRGALTAGFTRLADSAKGDVPLRSHLASLYGTRCPVCRASGVAEWFAWRRDIRQPFEKGVRCQGCGEVQVGPADKDDVEMARSFAPRGLPYYYALDRAAPLMRHGHHPAEDRAAELVACYTPRNLSALMDVSRRVESMEATRSVRIGLMALLLDCFDRCSKLYPYGEDRARPRAIRVPVRYLERNVWLCLEEGISRLDPSRWLSPVPETENVDALVQGARDGYALVARAARDVGEILPALSVDLVLVDPPRPDGVFWALSALWAAWLWDTAEAHAMRPFLRRRRFDWHWHWQALREALAAVGPRLKAEGILAMLFSAPDQAMVGSACLAATAAGYDLRSWGYAPEIGYRLTWRWEGTEPPESVGRETLEREVIAEVEAGALSALRDRGEPSSNRLLHAMAHARLADRGLLRSVAALGQDVAPMGFLASAVDQGLRTAPLLRLDEGTKMQEPLWWLDRPHGPLHTLADRVEALVRLLLAGRPVWPEANLVNAIYEHFPDVLTPELELVLVCVASYGVPEDGAIRLRPEDDLERRRLETDTVREQLVELGRRLEFRTDEGGAWAVRWLEDREEVYVFSISATAAVSSSLLSERVTDPRTQRCLVVPGGRAELVDLKLRRDPRLARAVDPGTGPASESGLAWQFIKFRHLRRLVAEEDLDRYAFKTVLGLDPIAEREDAQLPLF